MLIKSIFIHVLVRFCFLLTTPIPHRSPFIHSFLAHSLSFLCSSTFVFIKAGFLLFIKFLKKQKNLEIYAVFGRLQIKTSPCIVPVIANQLLLGSNRRVLSSNQAAINKLSPASLTKNTNQRCAFFYFWRSYRPIGDELARRSFPPLDWMPKSFSMALGLVSRNLTT